MYTGFVITFLRVYDSELGEHGGGQGRGGGGGYLFSVWGVGGQHVGMRNSKIKVHVVLPGELSLVSDIGPVMGSASLVGWAGGGLHREGGGSCGLTV